MRIRRDTSTDDFGGEEYHVGDDTKHYVVRSYVVGGRFHASRVDFRVWSPNAYNTSGTRGDFAWSHRELRPASKSGKAAVRAVVRHLEARKRFGVNEPMAHRQWVDLLG